MAELHRAVERLVDRLEMTPLAFARSAVIDWRRKNFYKRVFRPMETLLRSLNGCRNGAPNMSGSETTETVVAMSTRTRCSAMSSYEAPHLQVDADTARQSNSPWWPVHYGRTRTGMGCETMFCNFRGAAVSEALNAHHTSSEYERCPNCAIPFHGLMSRAETAGEKPMVGTATP
ncbi:hypothetical protein [Azospirillum brasilense]|uniref:hypothetical protein n=1 Tax=Azospirillum brasilense TaxID=192 RepID=UPI00119EAD3C|nr:hypothetical protein [Azospirillum brasilense]